jgi:hypothetical protein
MGGLVRHSLGFLDYTLAGRLHSQPTLHYLRPLHELGAYKRLRIPTLRQQSDELRSKKKELEH